MAERRLVALAMATLLAAPAAAGAQDYQWTAERPDGIAPIGVVADRTLPAGVLEVGYRFAHMDAEGVKVQADFISPLDLLDQFAIVPLARTTKSHLFTVAYGIDDDLTLLASGGYVSKTREQGDEDLADGFIFLTESGDVADIEVDALYRVYDEGPYRAHLQLGAVIPVGSVEERGDLPTQADQLLPYDMQIGSGSFSLVPGVAAQMMNEAGSVGAQIRGVIRLNDNDRDYRLGDMVEATGWAAYRFNEYFSGSGRVRVTNVGRVGGGDPVLEAFGDRDPGDVGFFYSGTRVDLPVGLNVRMPHGPLEGHRVGVEFVWTVHEDFDGPHAANDFGFTLGWQSTFDLGF